jgi:hypothetical protein
MRPRAGSTPGLCEKETAMAENKTKPTVASVTAFLNKVPDPQVRKDCFAILKMMQAVSKKEPVMWGSSIVGFGTFHYVYESGREGDTVVIGFSPRKQNISIYMMCSLEKVKSELVKLGKYETGKGCLYIKSLGDVDTAALKKVLAKGFKEASKLNVHSS